MLHASTVPHTANRNRRSVNLGSRYHRSVERLWLQKVSSRNGYTTFGLRSHCTSRRAGSSTLALYFGIPARPFVYPSFVWGILSPWSDSPCNVACSWGGQPGSMAPGKVLQSLSHYAFNDHLISRSTYNYTVYPLPSNSSDLSGSSVNHIRQRGFGKSCCGLPSLVSCLVDGTLFLTPELDNND
jgi:hypothetical protein